MIWVGRDIYSALKYYCTAFDESLFLLANIIIDATLYHLFGNIRKMEFQIFNA